LSQTSFFRLRAGKDSLTWGETTKNVHVTANDEQVMRQRAKKIKS